ncbi:hypothetical protein PtA15_2A920 [Puccinia triticina]|nr:uncharacterized protein PtA15_2A920 [Puccinia triticina]WAQ82603.1 hypothetical protein PtA15_2A920 [Puccinia triticina]
MFSNVLQALLFCAVFQLISASVAGAKSDFDKLRTDRVVSRRDGLAPLTKDGSLVRRQDWGSSASASASASVSVSAQVMLQSWSSLTAAADKCRDVFQQGASMEVALQAASSFSYQAVAVNRQAGRCACDSSAFDVSAQFKAQIVHLFSSLQVTLKLGAERYGSDWSNRFRPVFQDCSPAFASMKQISAQLNIDLAATLKQAHLDLGVFLNVGLNVNALLGLNLRIGGLLSL